MRITKPLNTTLIISAICLLLACSGDDNPPVDGASTELKVTYVDFDGDEPTAKLLIEGMSCERMCVSAVKKSMASVPTVTIEDMLFDTEVSVDTLIVHFDPTKVTQRDLIKAVEDLAGGDTYRVKEIQLSKDAKTSCTRERSDTKSQAKGAEVRQYTFSVPNPFEILRKVAL